MTAIDAMREMLRTPIPLIEHDAGGFDSPNGNAPGLTGWTFDVHGTARVAA